MFLKLPVEVVRCIIIEWLNVSSICRLDSAFYSEEDRTEFLEQLSAEHSILLDWRQVRGTKYFRRKNNDYLTWFYRWASSRQLKVSYIEMDGYTEPAVLAKYLQITGFCVRSVQFSELRSDKMETRISLAINSLGNLQEVQIYNCTLTASVRDLLLACADTLRKLSMIFCDNVDPDYFSGIRCPQLTMVTTSCYKESTTAILSISDRITHLNCARNYYDSYTFLYLPCCAGLRKLNLSGTNVRDADILTVCDNCTQLDAIDIRECIRLTDVAIIALVTKCSHLRTLWMSNNHNYTDTSLHAIAKHAPYLQSLNIRVCRQLTTVAVLNVLTACQSLHTYFLDSSVRESTYMLQIAQHLPGTITHLCVFDYVIPNAVLMAVAKRCTLLQHLDMRYCTAEAQEQQQGITAVASGCPRLRTVVVRDEDASTLRSVWQVLRPDVRVLTSKEQPLPRLFN